MNIVEQVKVEWKSSFFLVFRNYISKNVPRTFVLWSRRTYLHLITRMSYPAGIISMLNWSSKSKVLTLNIKIMRSSVLKSEFLVLCIWGSRIGFNLIFSSSLIDTVAKPFIKGSSMDQVFILKFKSAHIVYRYQTFKIKVTPYNSSESKTKERKVLT